MKRKKLIWIPVSAGVLHKNGELLLGLRPENKSLSGLWEFPGGKIEAGEQPDQALKRELEEELGVEASIGPLLFSIAHNYGDVGVLLLFFDVPYWKGEVKPVHHDSVKWFPLEQIPQLDLPEANRLVLPKIIGHYNNTDS